MKPSQYKQSLCVIYSTFPLAQFAQTELNQKHAGLHGSSVCLHRHV